MDHDAGDQIASHRNSGSGSGGRDPLHKFIPSHAHNAMSAGYVPRSPRTTSPFPTQSNSNTALGGDGGNSQRLLRVTAPRGFATGSPTSRSSPGSSGGMWPGTQLDSMMGTSPPMGSMPPWNGGDTVAGLVHRPHGYDGGPSSHGRPDGSLTTSPVQRSPVAGISQAFSHDSVTMQELIAQQQNYQHQRLHTPTGVTIIYPQHVSPIDAAVVRAAEYASAQDAVSNPEDSPNEDRLQVRVEGYYEATDVNVLIPNDLPPSTLLYVLTASDGRDLMFKLTQYTLQLGICFLKMPSLFSPEVIAFTGPWAERLFRNYNTIRHGRSLFKIGRGLLNLFTVQTVCERMWMKYESAISQGTCAVLLPPISGLEQGLLLLGASPSWGRWLSRQLLHWSQAMELGPASASRGGDDSRNSPTTDWRLTDHSNRRQVRPEQPGVLFADDTFTHVSAVEQGMLTSVTGAAAQSGDHIARSGMWGDLGLVGLSTGSPLEPGSASVQLPALSASGRGEGEGATPSSAAPSTKTSVHHLRGPPAHEEREDDVDLEDSNSPRAGAGTTAGHGDAIQHLAATAATARHDHENNALEGSEKDRPPHSTASPSTSSADRDVCGLVPAALPFVTDTIPDTVEPVLMSGVSASSPAHHTISTPSSTGMTITNDATTRDTMPQGEDGEVADQQRQHQGRTTLLRPLPRTSDPQSSTADADMSLGAGRGADGEAYRLHGGEDDEEEEVNAAGSHGRSLIPASHGHGPTSMPDNWRPAQAPTVPPSQSDEFDYGGGMGFPESLPQNEKGLYFPTEAMTNATSSSSSPAPEAGTGADLQQRLKKMDAAETKAAVAQQDAPMVDHDNSHNNNARQNENGLRRRSRRGVPAFEMAPAVPGHAPAAASVAAAYMVSDGSSTPAPVSAGGVKDGVAGVDGSDMSIVSSAANSSFHVQPPAASGMMATWLNELQPASAALPARLRKGILQFNPILMMLLGVRNLAAALRRFLRDMTLISSERFVTVSFVETNRHPITRLINRCWLLVSIIDLLLNTVRLLQPGWGKYATARQNVKCRCGCAEDADPADSVWRAHGVIARRKTDLFFPPLNLDYGAPFVSTITYMEAADPARLMPACAHCGCLYKEIPSEEEMAAAGAGEMESQSIVHSDSTAATRSLQPSLGLSEEAEGRLVHGGRRGTQRPARGSTYAAAAVGGDAGDIMGLVARLPGDGQHSRCGLTDRRNTVNREVESATGILFVPRMMRKFFDYVWLLRVHPNLASTILLEVRYIAEFYMAYKYCFDGFETFTADAPLQSILHPWGAVAGMVSAAVGLLRVVESAPTS